MTSDEIVLHREKKYLEIGAKLNTGDDFIEIESTNDLSSIDISTLPFPGIATDLQPIFGAALLRAQGTSIITENVYDQRFQWIPEVQRMGADIQVIGNVAKIFGKRKLNGAELIATDLRASVCLVLAGLVASNKTILNRIYHLKGPLLFADSYSVFKRRLWQLKTTKTQNIFSFSSTRQKREHKLPVIQIKGLVIQVSLRK